MNGLNDKYEGLRRFVEEKGRNGVIIALSGGVDSSTLAAICHDVLRKMAVAVTAKSPTYPAEEIDEAKRISQKIGIKHYTVESDELSNQDFSRNPEDRCYYCKKELLDCLQDFANRLGFKAIFEGTNFSELAGHRPGFQAVKERENVFSPWAENQITKDEIRTLAQKFGLSVHDKPALACLASRIPFGEQITLKRLNRVGRAERFIKEITEIRQIRVRDHNGLARIEVGRDERSKLFNLGTIDKIVEEFRQLGFEYVTLDLEGYRTGSMLSIGTSEENHGLNE